MTKPDRVRQGSVVVFIPHVPAKAEENIKFFVSKMQFGDHTARYAKHNLDIRSKCYEGIKYMCKK